MLHVYIPTGVDCPIVVKFFKSGPLARPVNNLSKQNLFLSSISGALDNLQSQFQSLQITRHQPAKLTVQTAMRVAVMRVTASTYRLYMT